jgi:predicted ester cyclase
MTQAPETQVPAETFEVALAVAKIFATLDAEAAQKYIAPDFVDHESSSPEIGSGPAGYLATARYMREAFSEAQWRPVEFFAAGDKFATVVEFTGRHTGDFLGLPPSGKEIRVRHLHFYRVANGQAVEHWGARDELSLMRQIGVLPETSAATPADAAQAS